MEKKRLFEYGVVSKKNVGNDFNCIMVFGDEDGFRIPTPNENMIIHKGSLKASRNVLQESFLGADIYIDIDENNKELRGELTPYATDFVLNNRGYYEIADKKYYVLRFEDDDPSLSAYDKSVLRNMAKTAPIVYTTEEPFLINFAKPTEPSHMGFLISRTELDPLLKNGVEGMAYKDHFDIYKQNGKAITKMDIEDAFDEVRTDIGSKVKPSKKSPRIDTFFPYLYNPEDLELLPQQLRNGNLCEFEFNGQLNEEGLPIWKSSIKVMQNEHVEEFIDKLEKTGHKMYIKLDPTKFTPDQYEKLAEANLIEEFELIKKENGMHYYVSRTLNKNLDTNYGKAI